MPRRDTPRRQRELHRPDYEAAGITVKRSARPARIRMMASTGLPRVACQLGSHDEDRMPQQPALGARPNVLDRYRVVSSQDRVIPRRVLWRSPVDVSPVSPVPFERFCQEAFRSRRGA
jgi:hypothetical protein